MTWFFVSPDYNNKGTLNIDPVVFLCRPSAHVHTVLTTTFRADDNFPAGVCRALKQVQHKQPQAKDC